MPDPNFYCHYCDQYSERSPCEHCGNRPQSMTPVKDAYWRGSVGEARQALAALDKEKAGG